MGSSVTLVVRKADLRHWRVRFGLCSTNRFTVNKYVPIQKLEIELMKVQGSSIFANFDHLHE